jgi:hypothetical protein
MELSILRDLAANVADFDECLIEICHNLSSFVMQSIGFALQSVKRGNAVLVLYRPTVFRWNEDADHTAWRSQRPRCHGKAGNDERRDDMKCLTGTANRCPGCGGASQVEEDAGIRPFLKPRKTRHKDCDGSKHFPNAKYGHKVQRVAKDVYKAIDIVLQMRHLGDTAASYRQGYEYGRYPISD